MKKFKTHISPEIYDLTQTEKQKLHPGAFVGGPNRKFRRQVLGITGSQFKRRKMDELIDGELAQIQTEYLLERLKTNEQD